MNTPSILEDAIELHAILYQYEDYLVDLPDKLSHTGTNTIHDQIISFHDIYNSITERVHDLTETLEPEDELLEIEEELLKTEEVLDRIVMIANERWFNSLETIEYEDSPNSNIEEGIQTPPVIEEIRCL